MQAARLLARRHQKMLMQCHVRVASHVALTPLFANLARMSTSLYPFARLVVIGRALGITGSEHLVHFVRVFAMTSCLEHVSALAQAGQSR